MNSSNIPINPKNCNQYTANFILYKVFCIANTGLIWQTTLIIFTNPIQLKLRTLKRTKPQEILPAIWNYLNFT